jgi:hypothetical protein
MHNSIILTYMDIEYNSSINQKYGKIYIINEI